MVPTANNKEVCGVCSTVEIATHRCGKDCTHISPVYITPMYVLPTTGHTRQTSLIDDPATHTLCRRAVSYRSRRQKRAAHIDLMDQPRNICAEELSPIDHPRKICAEELSYNRSHPANMCSSYYRSSAEDMCRRAVSYTRQLTPDKYVQKSYCISYNRSHPANTCSSCSFHRSSAGNMCRRVVFYSSHPTRDWPL